jgi:hypothetical protein
MACTGAHCTNHGTGTTTCAGHRSSCPTNRTLSGLSISTGTSIVASQITHLRSQIRAELARWNQHNWYNFTITEPYAYGSSTIVTDDHVENLMAMVVLPYGSADIGGLVYPRREVDGLTIQDTDWDNVAESVVVKYNIIRQNCICNSDCSCNAVCSCHNDCGCNYSDPRLKTEIRPLVH